jgi:hypothetical protein
MNHLRVFVLSMCIFAALWLPCTSIHAADDFATDLLQLVSFAPPPIKSHRRRTESDKYRQTDDPHPSRWKEKWDQRNGFTEKNRRKSLGSLPDEKDTLERELKIVESKSSGAVEARTPKKVLWMEYEKAKAACTLPLGTKRLKPFTVTGTARP